MRVVPVPCLSDNYAYVLLDDATKTAAVVDPVEPRKVLPAVQAEGPFVITHLLTTHYHSDHSGGNEAFVREVPGVQVVAFHDHRGRTPCVNTPVQDGEVFKIGSLTVRVTHVPCHTRCHVFYYVTSDDEREAPIVFTGDTLFSAGCGRFFEGTAAEMQYALNTVAASLPPETLVFPGHEYTVANLKFARTVEADNADAAEHLALCERLRTQDTPTVPSTIDRERRINPFMRLSSPSLRAALEQPAAAPDVAVLAALRARKDAFRA